MTCREMDAALDSGRLDDAAARHAAECPRCGALVRALEAAAPAQGFAAQALDVRSIEAAILSDLRPVRRLPSAAVSLGAMAVAVAAAIAAGGALLHPGAWPLLGEARQFAVFLPLAVCCALLAAWLERQMSPGRKYGGVLGIGAMASAAILAGVLLTSFQPTAEPSFVAHGLICLRAGLAFAIPTAAVLFLILRRGAALEPLRTGAAAGALAGLAGLAILELHCPNFNAWHIWVWHAGVTAVCALAGLAAGRLLYKV